MMFVIVFDWKAGYNLIPYVLCQHFPPDFLPPEGYGKILFVLVS